MKTVILIFALVALVAFFILGYVIYRLRDCLDFTQKINSFIEEDNRRLNDEKLKYYVECAKLQMKVNSLQRAQKNASKEQ